MPVQEGCRQLPPSYVAYLGPMPTPWRSRDSPDALWSREVGQAWQTDTAIVCIELYIPSFSSLAICRRARDSFAVALHSPSENWSRTSAAAILVRTESHLLQSLRTHSTWATQVESHHASTLLLVHATPSPHFLLCNAHLFFDKISVTYIDRAPDIAMTTPIPQPPGIPLLGNIFDIDTSNTWTSLQKLWEKHGQCIP
jgi:hypothetical protein